MSKSNPYPKIGENPKTKVPSGIDKFSIAFSIGEMGLYFEYKSLFLYDTEKPCLASTKQGFSLIIVSNFF